MLPPVYEQEETHHKEDNLPDSFLQGATDRGEMDYLAKDWRSVDVDSMLNSQVLAFYEILLALR
jgi:hypothetical protein